MRADKITLQFVRPGRTIENYTGPGWYVSATDADQEDQTWLQRPRKITPDQALRLAAVLDEVAGNAPVTRGFASGVINQNAWAKRQAAEAVKAQEAAVERLTIVRKDWESYPIPEVRTTHRIYAYGQSSMDGWGCKDCSWQAGPDLTYEQAAISHGSDRNIPAALALGDG